MKYILGYSRDDWGGIKNRHLKTVCNTICVARRVNTEIYVFEAFEICAGVEVQPERLGVPDGGGKSMP